VTQLAFFLVPSHINMAESNSPTIAGVVYIPGSGAKSSLVFQPLSGQPVLQHAINAVQGVTGKMPGLIPDHALGSFPGDFTFEGALLQPDGQSSIIRGIFENLNGEADHLLFFPANLPLVAPGSLDRLITGHLEASPQSVISSLNAVDHKGQETLNAAGGVFCVQTKWLAGIKSRISTSISLDAMRKYLVQTATSSGLATLDLDFIDPIEGLELESLVDLAQAESILHQRTNHNLMHNGVVIVDPDSTYIDMQVEIDRDTVIHPNTYLRGSTKIGKACRIGPNSMIIDTRIGDRCEVTFSVAENAILEDDVDIGPFAHLRKGAHLAQGVHMGNYGEVKNSYLGPGTKMGHFSYIGDANIGPDVNIGAGVITANYDGRNKHPTEIGAGAFIGSDTMLIAPLKIGAGARTGAGSVVTKDVPPNSLAVGTPARIIRKKEDNDGP
jgi:bifunctional UDP-N-acetylglucosamine pyrophosphorylase/glucosamine-1-phosphate N-acetyltransferase